MIYKKINFLFGKSISKIDLAIVPMIVLSLLVFCNINGVLVSLFGVSALGSPLMLLSSFVLLYLLPLPRAALNIPLKVIVSSILLFWIVGFISSLLNLSERPEIMGYLIEGSREILTGLILIVVFYIFTYNYAQKNPNKDILSFVFVFFLITLLAGIFESQLGLRTTLYGPEEGTRSLGFFGNPNETGLQANLTAIIAYYLYNNRKINIIIFLGILLLCTLGAFMSFSKTAIITNVFLLIFYLGYTLFSILSFRKVKRNLYTIITVVGMSIMVVIFLINPRMEELEPAQLKRLEDIVRLTVFGEVSNRTTSSRSGIFSDGMERILDKPILGHGLSTFTYGGLFPSSPTHGVHNLYLRIAGEAGVIVFAIVMLAMLFTVILAVRKSHDNSSFIVVLFMICFALYSGTSHNVFGKKFLVSLWGVLLFYSTKKNVVLR